MSENSIGPKLPPGFNENCCNNDNDSESDSSNTDKKEDIGPALPPGFYSSRQNNTELIGPVPKFQEGKSKKSSPDSADNYVTSSSSSNQPDMSYGPSLPPGFQINFNDTDNTNEASDSEDEDIIGPMPAAGHEVINSVAHDFEARAEAMKNKLTGNVEEKVERESWMMELPDYGKNFGLGPRTFRKTAAPSKQDRSGWTETPADRERRMKEAQAKSMAGGSEPERAVKEKSINKETTERDREIEERISSFNAQARGESLVDMHQKERKRKMEEDGQQKNERRPFNREVDLQVNRFDDAKKKRLIKESAKLNDKFSHGSDKIYL